MNILLVDIESISRNNFKRYYKNHNLNRYNLDSRNLEHQILNIHLSSHCYLNNHHNNYNHLQDQTDDAFFFSRLILENYLGFSASLKAFSRQCDPLKQSSLLYLIFNILRTRMLTIQYTIGTSKTFMGREILLIACNRKYR